MFNDQDYLIALQIQYDLDNDENLDKSKDEKQTGNKQLEMPPDKHLVNPEWELIDPNPDIRALFQEYDKKYFYSRLGSCIVEWSKRMTICAGIFYLREGGIIRLSEPLLKYRPRIDMVQTLLHEMIHAYLYLTRNYKDRGEHGDEFKKHMNRINSAAGTNITVYHTFHDEVNYQRQHVWRCTGICRTWKPFMGFVKRSMNRAPGPHDLWWADHARKCSGIFEKIAEPEGFKSKQIKRKSDDSICSNEPSQASAKAKKKVVSSDDKSLVKINTFFQSNNLKTKPQTQNENDDILILDEVSTDYKEDILILNRSTQPSSIDCPICFHKLSKEKIDMHVNNHFN